MKRRTEVTSVKRENLFIHKEYERHETPADTEAG